jgi:AcrR family transcriptional regulator
MARKATPRGRGRPPRTARDTGTSRAELITAAASVFAERGYDGATVEEVIRRAGLSKGTFYFNFADKEHLFLSVIQERLDNPVRALMAITTAAAGSTPTAGTVSAGLDELLRNERNTVLLLQEYVSRAARDPTVAAHYRDRQASLRSGLAETLRVRHQHTGVPLTFDAERLARAFIALGHGLALDTVVDPDATDASLYGDILSLVYDGLVARADARG